MSSSECLVSDPVPGREREMAWAARVYAARALWDEEYLLAGPGATIRQASSQDHAATLASWSAALAALGHLDEAGRLACQGRRVAWLAGSSPALLASLDCAELPAWRGDGPATQRAAARQAAAAAELGRADLENAATAALMTLHLSRCQYAAAFSGAAQLAHADLGGLGRQALSVLVEAGSRLGRRDAAERALGRLRPCARAAGTAWALGVLARCEALLAGDDAAADSYEQAITLLDTTSVISERAHARLLYGEWLRRRRQRGAARGRLGEARQLFREMGAAEFARRADRELAATSPPGQGRSRLAPFTAPTLTLAEQRVAELAAAGSTNKEIAAELFVSRRTVDHHLRNTYGKLGVNSRRQLGSVLPGPVGSLLPVNTSAAVGRCSAAILAASAAGMP